MALETLKGVKKIGGFKVCRLDQEPPHAGTAKQGSPVYVSNEGNYIGFRIQDGPIKEHGVNGCQVDTIIEAAKKILEGLNEKFPDWRNEDAMNSLDDALYRLEQRTKDREKRQVDVTE